MAVNDNERTINFYKKPLFIYQDERSYEINFERWYRSNILEREMWNLDPLDIELAEQLFDKQWRFKKT